MRELKFEGLAGLAQVELLRDVARRLWAHDDVKAIWIGGSLARGNADRYSDVDVRVAVAPEAFAAWRTAEMQRFFPENVVGRKVQPWGEDAVLHHMVLGNGDIYDLFVQTTARDNPEDAVVILGCRDGEFAKKLATFTRPVASGFAAAEKEVLRNVLVDFWITTHKHRKVLARNMQVLVLTGLQFDRATLTRLWYAQVTGNDTGNRRPSIFEMSEVARVVEQNVPVATEVLGMATQTKEQIHRAIERVRDEALKVGRALATKLRFDYPADLEATARRGWLNYLEDVK